MYYEMARIDIRISIYLFIEDVCKLASFGHFIDQLNISLSETPILLSTYTFEEV